MGSRIWTIVALLMVLAGLGAGNPASARQTAAGAKMLHLDKKMVAKGRYLSRIAGCNDCHTEGYLLSEGTVPETQWLTGATLGWRGPWGTTYGANLRLFVNGLTEEQWLATARHLKTRPPMPWFTLNSMEEADLVALYQFIRFLGPAGQPAPAYVPPGQEPSTPFALFPSPPPK